MIEINSSRINKDAFLNEVQNNINTYNKFPKIRKKTDVKNVEFSNYINPSLKEHSSKTFKVLSFIAKILHHLGLSRLVSIGKNLLEDKITKQNVYLVTDFTKYSGAEFIKNLFLGLLKREASKEEIHHYLNFLNSGKRSKTEILAAIRFSKEGKLNATPILGIKKRYIMAMLFKLPIVSYFFKIIIFILRIPANMEKANRSELLYESQTQKLNQLQSMNNHLEQKYDEITKQLNQAKIDLTNNIDQKVNLSDFHKDMFEFQTKTDTNIDIKHNKSIHFTQEKFAELNKQMELYVKDVNNAKAYLNDAQVNLKSLIKQAKEQIQETKPSELLTDIVKEDDYLLDNFYVAFEDKFRGSREDIQKRQEYYLPLVKDVIKDTQELVIDVGCGRGEWIELLQNNSIKARGIDLNRLMVNESISYKLDAITQDAIKYLKGLESSSVAVVTGFHIVEHLPFKVLIELFDESLRVLKTGGMIIFETPNPENILVGSCSFYTDPTHVNPIPPVSLEFIATNRGFTNIKIHRLSPIKEPEFLKGENTHDVNNLIFASTKEQDYSVVGYKI